MVILFLKEKLKIPLLVKRLTLLAVLLRVGKYIILTIRNALKPSRNSRRENITLRRLLILLLFKILLSILITLIKFIRNLTLLL